MGEQNRNNIVYFYSGKPIEMSEQDIVFDDSTYSDYDVLNKSKEIKLDIPQKDANRMLAFIFNVPLRVIHLSKLGKTKRVRKKNKNRFKGSIKVWKH